MTSRSGRSYVGKMLTVEAQHWRTTIGILVKREMARLGLEMIVRQKFSLDITFFWRDAKSQFDCDNTIKMLQDSMNKIAYSSDKLCLPRALDFFYDESKPRIEFTIACPYRPIETGEVTLASLGIV